MAYFDTTWYVNFGDGSTTGHFAVAKRPQNTAVVAGQLARQFTAPAVGNERVFVCIVAGTTANVTDATWVITRGSKTTDGTATWQECTGASAINGDLTGTPSWATVKATASIMSLGVIIKRNNGASYQICTTAPGSALGASEPAFSNTAGATTTDNTTVWTCLGPVGNFTGGQGPFARFASVFGSNWFASGNAIYVGDNHAETQSSSNTITINSALMCKILCHNHSGSYPPAAGDLTTGATITVTGASAISLLFNGSFYVLGMTFISVNNIAIGQNIVTQGQNWHYFDSCSFQISGSGATTVIQIGHSAAATWNAIIFDNTTVKFGATTQYMLPQTAQFTWRNTGQVLVSGSSIPATLFQSATSAGNNNIVALEGLDLSQLTGSLFANATGVSIGSLVVQDCKLHASMTVTTPGNTGMIVQLIRCNSGAVSYTSTRYAYEGTETTETSITRVGGAEDPTGQAQTRKIVTTANTQWLRPFQAEPYAIWNATTGANVTVTVYGTINSGSLPLNDELFMEVEYLGSSSQPLGSIATTSKATVLSTGAAVSSDGSTWNGGGSGGGWSPFKLVATLSSPQPGMVGYMNVRVRAAKASTTYYIDPKIELT